MNHPRGLAAPPWRRKIVSLALAGCLLAGVAALPGHADPTEQADQQYRPLVHFSPEKNWMNDPNGMVYVDGVYHLFFQYNPEGTTWGNMSWGHATSTDLVTWEQHPVAIPQTFNDEGVSIEDIFSGSVVVDENNTSGFGEPGGETPLVAIYTSAYTGAHPSLAGIQAQSLAYSLDKGMTWTKYDGNPVLDRGSANFRDPKVFWYEGDTESYWVMVAVEATEHKVVLYRSDDLKEWDHLSDFGPANSMAGIWECPDLFELPVDGDPDDTKWVMVVNLNPGAVAGGSGGQYFVGDFDGVTFTSESTVTADPLPEGVVFQDFENGYGDWVVNNEPGNEANGPFGDAPATGELDGQTPVTGFVGSGLVNSFLGQDWATGSLESPSFTIEKPYVNFLVGGGYHPPVPGGQIGNEPPAGSRVLFDFEDGELAANGWELTGDFATEPERNPSADAGNAYLGTYSVNTWLGGPEGDANTGTMTSPEFTIDGDHISFLIGAGSRDDGTLGVELVVDGETVRSATGRGDDRLNWASWEVSEFAGKQAQFRIVDQVESGSWPQIWVDHVVIGDEPAKVRSEEVTVNLIVDEQVVRSATGNESEILDWVSWDVAEFVGDEAQISVVDNNRFGWGHILADQFMFSDAPAAPRLERYDWLDWGRDYYATVSYSGTPDESTRIMHGWMNNWQYAEAIPTSTWRSSMTLPREVALVSTDRGPRLTQRVVDQVGDLLEKDKASMAADVALAGTTELGLSGEVARIDLTLDPGTAERSGIRVFGTADGVGTLIGYDATTGRVFVDRRNSGDVDFHPRFASVEDAPVARNEDGTVTLEVYLDRASVELFANGGLVTITDQVFPLAGADRIDGFAQGGEAVIRSIAVTPLTPTMWQGEPTESPSPEPSPRPTGPSTPGPSGGPSPEPTGSSSPDPSASPTPSPRPSKPGVGLPHTGS